MPPGSNGGGGETPGGQQTAPTGSGDGASGDSSSGSGGEQPQGGPGGWETSNELPPAQPRPAPPMPGQGSGAGTGGDEALEEALGEFDGEILAEREALEQRSNERPAGSGGTGTTGTNPTGGAAANSAGLPGASGTEGSATTRPGGQAPIPRSRPAPAMPQGQAPEDIPDARDDDIIARQLREAAMAESDPKLREKLWEEYRRYKGS